MPNKATQFNNGIPKVQFIDNRPSSAGRGYGVRWQKYSRAFIKKHPLCEICLKRGITTAARCVDHIRPHKGDMKLFWEKSNHQSACIPCNSRKAAMEEGGFGYKKKPETSGERILRLAMAGSM